VQPLLLWKNNKYYIFEMCVFAALGLHHAMRVHCIVICGLPGSTIFVQIINSTIKKKKLLDIKCVFWFSIEYFS
jgi:hypothetical protein